MPDSSATPSRPALAVICQTMPPYRRHLHRRLVQEVPELRLITINTHEDKTRDWRVAEDAEIGLVNLPESDRARRSHLWGFRDRLQQGSQAIQILQKERVAAVVVNGYFDAGRVRVFRWCHAQNIPCFMFGDSNICSERLVAPWKKQLKRRYIEWLNKRLTGFFVCGSYGAEYYQHYGVPREKIFIAPYEPDYSLITELPHSYIDEVAAEYGLATNRRRLLFCGRLIEVKRPDLLVDAFINMADQRPDWDLVMLGDGHQKESLVQSIPKRLGERVKWIPFTNEQQRVSAVYRACDALVLPSDYEPWALVINEAAAAGLAIVSTDVVGAAVELVADGENGRLVPPGKVEPLRDALVEVTAPENIDRMKAASARCLADWQNRGDPVAGYRQALEYAGVLKP